MSMNNRTLWVNYRNFEQEALWTQCNQDLCVTKLTEIGRCFLHVIRLYSSAVAICLLRSRSKQPNSLTCIINFNHFLQSSPWPLQQWPLYHQNSLRSYTSILARTKIMLYCFGASSQTHVCIYYPWTRASPKIRTVEWLTGDSPIDALFWNCGGI